jgi:hypothetical protein
VPPQNDNAASSSYATPEDRNTVCNEGTTRKVIKKRKYLGETGLYDLTCVKKSIKGIKE